MGHGLCCSTNRDGRYRFMVGLAFFLGMAFQQVGLIGTSVTNAGFLTALYVIMVPVIMISVLRVAQPFIIWPASILALIGIYLLSGGNLASLNSGDILIIICALFWAGHAGGLGFTLQAVGQRYTSESAAAVLISTESLFAAMFGAFFLGERLQNLGYLGCGLIFVAILMVELMPKKVISPLAR